jgi:acetolactate synthase I/III small subunit
MNLTKTDGDSMLHIINVLVDNHFGVLSRISGMFSARGYNIESLCVGITEDPSISRMTVAVYGDEAIVDQIIHQLNKVVEVIEVSDLTCDKHVERELVLARLSTKLNKRADLLEVVSIFRAKVVDVSDEAIIIEATGTTEKIRAFIDMIRPYGIEQLARTGIIALARSNNDISS